MLALNLCISAKVLMERSRKVSTGLIDTPFVNEDDFAPLTKGLGAIRAS